jgi:hypothetical protein
MTELLDIKPLVDQYDNIIAEETRLIEEPLLDIKNQLVNDTNKNLRESFGEFLYTCLGDNITGQTHTAINQKWLDNAADGASILEDARDNNISIDDALKNRRKGVCYSYNNRHSIQQAFISVGKHFGISHYAGEGTRKTTFSICPAKIFTYLTQTHVDLIKNRLKRECAQDFLDFRNEFIEKAKNYTQQYIKLENPINIDVSTISKITPVVYQYGHGPKEVNILTDHTNIDITHVVYSIPPFNVWNEYDSVSKSCSYSTNAKPNYITLGFLNINEETNQYTVIGGFDVTIDMIYHTLKILNNNSSIYNIECHLPKTDQAPYITYITQDNKYVKSDDTRFPLNLHKVFDNVEVNGLISNMIKFLVDSTDELTKLKFKHSTLYFINSDL